MSNQELLHEISVMLDEKLDKKLDEKLGPINRRIENLEACMNRLEETTNKLSERIEGLEACMDRLEETTDRLKETTDRLQVTTDKLVEDMRYVRVVQLENNVIPRLNTIEACYIDAAKKFSDRADQIDMIQSDVDVIRVVVSKHSEQLLQIS